MLGRASVTYAVWSKEDKEMGGPQSQGYYCDGHYYPWTSDPEDITMSVADALRGELFLGGEAELTHNGGMVSSGSHDVDYATGTECYYCLHIRCKPETFKRLCAHIGASL